LASQILFASGSSILTSSGQTALLDIRDKLQDIVKNTADKTDFMIYVTGHADKTKVTKNININRMLSAKRAVSVVEFLQNHNIPAEYLAAVAMGEYHPISTGDTVSDYAKNRRIEIVVKRRI
jgi:chemotaxis protein MotB